MMQVSYSVGTAANGSGNIRRAIFVSERGAPMARAGFQRRVERAGVAAGFDFPVHPHMLRHECRYRLANEGRNAFKIKHSWVIRVWI
jgi:site-specific recombinase XerD